MRTRARSWAVVVALALLAAALCVGATGAPTGRARASRAGVEPFAPDVAAADGDARERSVSERCPPRDVAPAATGQRRLEIVFEGITETWRGREVVLCFWELGQPPSERVRVEVNRSVLCPAPAGAWRLQLEDDKGRALWGTDQEVAAAAAVAHVRLPPGGRVQGTIAEADRSPFVGQVHLGNAFVNTDASGAFDAGFLPEGVHDVGVAGGTGFVTVGRIEVRGEGEMRVHIGIRGTGSIAGRFLWEVMGEMWLSADVCREGRSVASINCEGQSFEMKHLEPGAYDLRSEALAAPLAFRVWAAQRTDLGDIETLPPLKWRHEPRLEAKKDED